MNIYGTGVPKLNPKILPDYNKLTAELNLSPNVRENAIKL